jgi:hypothetical protein
MFAGWFFELAVAEGPLLRDNSARTIS